MTLNGNNPLAGIHSVMEVPIMDDRKWAKIPDIEADAFFVDLEDSAPTALKREARERAVEVLRDPAHLGGRKAIPRVNNLETPWGYDDVVALARAGVEVLTYPKARSAGELETVRDICWRYDANPKLAVVIESARGLVNVEEIAQVGGLCGIFFGPSDLSLDSGVELYDETGMTSGAIDSARSTLAFVAAAYDIELFDALFVKDMKDRDQVAASVRNSRNMGFSGVLTFYPPHIEAINQAFAMNAEDLSYAEQVVSVYEAAMREGKTAVLLKGEALIIQDYKRALAILGRSI